MELKGKKVLVFGAGKSGIGAADLLNAVGACPVLYDGKADLDKEIVVNGYRFRILSLGHKTIGKVRAEKIKKEPKGEDKKCQDIQNSQP